MSYKQDTITMNKDVLKSVIADNQVQIPRYEVINRPFHFVDNCNYVLVGIHKERKSV